MKKTKTLKMSEREPNKEHNLAKAANKPEIACPVTNECIYRTGNNDAIPVKFD